MGKAKRQFFSLDRTMAFYELTKVTMSLLVVLIMSKIEREPIDQPQQHMMLVMLGPIDTRIIS
jgi:hypothetical protein